MSVDQDLFRSYFREFFWAAPATAARRRFRGGLCRGSVPNSLGTAFAQRPYYPCR